MIQINKYQQALSTFSAFSEGTSIELVEYIQSDKETKKSSFMNDKILVYIYQKGIKSTAILWLRHFLDICISKSGKSIVSILLENKDEETINLPDRFEILNTQNNNGKVEIKMFFNL